MWTWINSTLSVFGQYDFIFINIVLIVTVTIVGIPLLLYCCNTYVQGARDQRVVLHDAVKGEATEAEPSHEAAPPAPLSGPYLAPSHMPAKAQPVTGGTPL